MKLFSSFVFFCSTVLIQVCQAESNCEHVVSFSNKISYTSPSRRLQDYTKCWIFDPPGENIIRLNFLKLRLDDPYCDYVYIKLTDDSGREEKVCNEYYGTDNMISMTGTVNVTLIIRNAWDYVSFYMEYNAESTICNTSQNYFRCSPYQCIRPEQVCDGVEDCEDGFDESDCGYPAIRGAKESRVNAINWLKSHQKSYGWRRNTHRAVTALYLTDAAKFTGNDVQEELIVKQLQLKIAAALLRNSTEPMSMNELSMYVNALSITCHDIRNIFSNDLLKILASRTFSTLPASPGAYLALCNADWPLSERNVYQLLNLLTKDIEYPFAFEIQAMTVMALSCINQKTSFLDNIYNASSIYNETIHNFMMNQKKDGSFGNAHTTAIVTQALISSGQAENSRWNVENAMFYLMKNLNSSSVDFLSVYLTLPLLKGKTLVDVSNANCSDNKRKLEDDEDILDVIDRHGPKIHVQYSLYIGDSKNVVHNVYLKVPENSTVYDVMKIAQIADPKYKFSYYKTNDHMYIYEMAGLSNDMEAGRFWLFYVTSRNNSELIHFTESPDQVTMRDKEHLIMWYRSANI